MLKNELTENKHTGRPTKRTPERAEKILAALRQGMTIATAVRAAGLGLSAFKTWRASDEAFAAAIKKAIAEGEAALVGVVQRATPKHWQAAAWLLERRWPERWARREPPPVEPREEAVKYDLSRLTKEELETIVELLKRAKLKPGEKPAEEKPFDLQ